MIEQLGRILTIGMIVGLCGCQPKEPTKRPSETTLGTLRVEPHAFSTKFNTASWERLNGELVPSDNFVPGAILAKPKQGVRSKATLAVTPGDKYEVLYSYQISRSPTNSEPVNFYIGPLFSDSEGQVIMNWKRVLISDSDKVTEAIGQVSSVRYEVVVPQGATVLRLGLSGAWQRGADVSDVVFRISHYSISKAE